MAVLALREHQPSEERAKRHRDPEQRAGPGRADAREQHREWKRLPSSASRDQPEEHRQNETADQRDRTDGGSSLCQDFGHDRQRHTARQDRNEQQQPDDAEILKEHHADDEASVRRVELIQRAQFLEHDRGARERNEEPRKEPDAPHRGLSRNGQDEQQDGSRGRANLKTAANQHLSPDPTDLGQ